MRINGVLEARHNSNGSNLKVLIERRCLAPLTLNDDVSRDVSRYQKLPQLQHLKLSVLKLDGSVFGDSLFFFFFSKFVSGFWLRLFFFFLLECIFSV